MGLVAWIENDWLIDWLIDWLTKILKLVAHHWRLGTVPHLRDRWSYNVSGSRGTIWRLVSAGTRRNYKLIFCVVDGHARLAELTLTDAENHRRRRRICDIFCR